MPAAYVGRDNEGDGHHLAHLAELDDIRRYSRRQARTISVAPVEDFVFVENDRLEQPGRLDVGDERVELRALHQREDVRERVELEFLIRGGRLRIFGSDRAPKLINLPGLALGRRRGEARSVGAHALAANSRSASARCSKFDLKTSS